MPAPAAAQSLESTAKAIGVAKEAVELLPSVAGTDIEAPALEIGGCGREFSGVVRRSTAFG